MNILLIDDSPSERMLLQARLRKLGHTVWLASDGEEGVSLFATNKPDLVLLDVVMPGIDGYEAARRMRATQPDWVPIIFLSGQAESADIAAGIDAGGDDYLVKPCDPTVLAAKMGSMQRIAAMREKLLVTTRELERANDALALMAQTDGLTGIGNRRALNDALDRELARAARDGEPASVILADVDHFKSYNDRYGHLAGDECLRAVAQALRGALRRPADFIGRYGGEEFGLVLPETAVDDALYVAERARLAVESLGIPAAHDGRPVTVSLGVATQHAPRGSACAELVLADADAALYAAKQAGRNRALHASPCPEAMARLAIAHAEGPAPRLRQ